MQLQSFEHGAKRMVDAAGKAVAHWLTGPSPRALGKAQ